MKTKFFNAFLASITLFAVSCNDKPDTDNTKPTINTPEFLNGNTVVAGDSLTLNLGFNDNLELSEAYIEIHHNFEGHSHQKANVRFEYNNILTLSGTKENLVQTIFIPQNASAGPYHLEVSALDKAGNRSDISVSEFFITNSGQPQFSNTTSSIKTIAGESFNISFLVDDDIDLQEISYQIVNVQSSGTSEFEDDIDLVGTSDKSFSFNQNFSLSTAGNYEFIVRALDNDDNQSVLKIDIEVK
ncbi:MAG: DUF4625 domain-containing protein [Flavobacteriales bacterium]|nr:DUF4625 domain-containing protein [Flavobacteriales bacterium]